MATKSDWYYRAAISGAAVIIVSVLGFYYFQFNRNLSDDPGVWGQFGDYFGGVVNPLLGFVTLIIVIRSAIVQMDAAAKANEILLDQQKLLRAEKFQKEFYDLLSFLNEYADKNIRVDNKTHEIYEQHRQAGLSFAGLPIEQAVQKASELVGQTMKGTKYERFMLAIRRVIKHIDTAEIKHYRQDEYMDMLMDYLALEEKVLLMNWAYFEWPRAKMWVANYPVAANISSANFILPDVQKFFSKGRRPS